MSKSIVFYLMLFICASAHLVSANTPVKHFPQVIVEVKGKDYALEFAHTFELRAQGLMFRESICEQCGMLFDFQQVKTAGMWMKNTLIPLDVAFITQEGKITDIKAMEPLSLSTTSSSEKVLYAWEMNQGWFQKNGIQVGDIVTIPAK